MKTQSNFDQKISGKVYVTFEGLDTRPGSRKGAKTTYSIDGFWKTPKTVNEVNAELLANGGNVSFLSNAKIIKISPRNWVAGEFRI